VYRLTELFFPGQCEIGEADLNLKPVSDDTIVPIPSTGNLGSQVEDIQRQAIIRALKKTRYNKTAAAKLLGLSLRQLRYRIEKLGIE
jgi:two-component system response regulator PilR (NtrC family)